MDLLLKPVTVSQCLAGKWNMPSPVQLLLRAASLKAPCVGVENKMNSIHLKDGIIRYNSSNSGFKVLFIAVRSH